MRRSAFTLVELLVTVAIIAILVAILLPSLAAARKTGRLTAGATNLRSCGQIMLTYTNDNKGDFLNPFRKSWPETAGGGDLKWWDVVSPTDSSMYWSMKGTPSFHTDRFMYVWYSYLAAYRGGGRMAAEMFSPADPYAINFTKDLEQIATEQDRYLVGSSYCYSQSFWVKPEAFGVAAPEFLRTGNINGVLHPSKKVVVWEATDCKPREPMFYPALAARPMVMLVDGSVLEQSIEDLTLREASAGLRPPTKFALTGSLGKYECNPPEPPDAPDPPLGLPGYFAYTAGGILGRDIP